MKIYLKLITTTILTLSIFISASASAAEMDYSVIVEPKYDEALTLSDGFIAVRNGDKWGYVNKAGEEIVAPQYDWCASFNEGKAIVATLINAPEYQSLYELGFVDANGKYTAFKGVDGEVAKVDKFTIIDEYGDRRFLGFLNGYFGVRTETLDNSYVMMYDSTGNYIKDNEVNYDFNEFKGVISDVYSDGLFCVASGTIGIGTGGSYFCDKNKNLVLSFPYQDLEGMYPKYYFLNVEPFFNGYAYAWVSDASDGKFLEKLVIVNKEGKIVVDGNYSSSFGMMAGATRYVMPFSSGLSTMRDGTTGKFGAVDVNGNVVIPFDYDKMSSFREGLLCVQKDGLYGYIDSKNNYIINPQFEQATHFYKGLAIVKKDNDIYIIDRYGNKFSGSENIPIDSYVKEDGAVFAPNDVITIKKDGKFGFAKLNYSLSKPLETEMSSWAYTEVVEAIEKKLVPMYLQNQYFENIKRSEFAELIIKALEEVTGKDKYEILKEKCNMTKVELYASNKFEDTSSESILIANKLGIINGVSETSYAPDKQIARQDAAALLMRSAKFCSNGEEITVTENTFKDDSSISDYAKNAVSYVTTLKIMQGVGNDNFDPTSTYTREQAYVTIVRLFNSLKN